MLPAPVSPTRRRYLQACLSALAAWQLPANSQADGLAFEGARMSADFDPTAAIWLGYDAGHEAFTGELAAALWNHVPIKMLVRDAEAQALAHAVLRGRGLDPNKVVFVQDARAPFFVRDCAVFGLDGRQRRFIIDFLWTHYGWTNWCRRVFAGSRRRAADCARTEDFETGQTDRRLARALGIDTFQSALAIEGGGVEVNGQGLIIVNENLWRSRNPALKRDEMQAHLLRLPGIRKVIWLPSGLAHDPLHRGSIVGPYVGWGTGGHTDEFVRFADARTVLLAWDLEAEVRSHPVAQLNRARMQVNFDLLSNSTDANGRPLRVLKVPLPRMVERPVVLSADADTAYSEQWTAASFPAREGRREGDALIQVATASYLNHVVANDVVLLPDYTAHGTPAAHQEQVRRIYESAFPGRRIRFIDAIGANWVGGGAHCATLNEPAGQE